MLFSSFTFLFFYLPLTLLFYFSLPPLLRLLGCRRNPLPLQNLLLLFFSLLFYSWGEPLYVFLMVATVLVNYLGGKGLAESRHPRRLLTLLVGANLALLFYFKYSAACLSLFGIFVTLPRMPIGISFYTFQAISYLVDIYRGRAKPARSAVDFGTYIALFPQLIAGPIVQYGEIAEALSCRQHTVTGAAAGARRFVAGLAKKVLLANVAGALFEDIVARGTAGLSAAAAWLMLLSFATQIYFDFSGYSDMAVGLGAIFGFRFPENFNYPYTAVSFTDFWRRWHITLSAFFRDYVYIPLGGSRHGVFRTVLCLFAVWSLTGLWHGASLNFLLWGLYFFLFLSLEKFLLARPLARLPRALRQALTLLGVLFGWLLFLLDGSSPALSLAALGDILLSLLGANGGAAGADLYDLVRHIPFFTLAALGATPLPRRLFQGLSHRSEVLAATLLPLLALFLSICYLAAGAHNPFLYFRF